MWHIQQCLACVLKCQLSLLVEKLLLFVAITKTVSSVADSFLTHVSVCLLSMNVWSFFTSSVSNHSWHIQHITAPKINKIRGAARQRWNKVTKSQYSEDLRPNMVARSSVTLNDCVHVVNSYEEVVPEMEKAEIWNKYKRDVSINLEQMEMCALRGFDDTHSEHFIMSVTLLGDEITGKWTDGSQTQTQRSRTVRGTFFVWVKMIEDQKQQESTRSVSFIFKSHFKESKVFLRWCNWCWRLGIYSQQYYHHGNQF